MTTMQGKALGRLALAVSLVSGGQAAAQQIFFDDFSQPDLAALRADGWTPRSKAGHPGVPGARWSAEGLTLLADPEQRGNRLLRLLASTDGSGPGTLQTQLCHQRKYLEGTYAARLRFRDTPRSGVDGDPVIQTFYIVSPLKHDFDPEFSELDWEYLPNGGWSSEKTRLYGISWQTVQLNPWKAYNQAHEEFASMDGWHVLAMQVLDGHTRLFIDGRPVAHHGGRNYPAVAMSINFNLWFSPGGLLPTREGAPARVYEQDVDWVFHARNARLSPDEVLARVAGLRAAGTAQLDQVPPAEPALQSRCDF